MKTDRVPRKTAKQVVIDFLNSALKKFQTGEPCYPPARVQLEVFKQISREMGWNTLADRITRALSATPPLPNDLPPFTVSRDPTDYQRE